jgi:putative transposase
MIFRGFRYKLQPSLEQESLFRQFVGVCRLVYNLALEQRRDWWRQFEQETGRPLNHVPPARELTVLRAEYDWITAVSQTCQRQALSDLDQAFANFFRGIARYPSPRKRGINDAFRFQGREVETTPLSGKWSALRLPKIGWVKFRNTRRMALDATGWHVSFACAIEPVTPATICPAVGIDRGIANTLALSTGERLSVPCSLDAIERRKRRAQKTLARKKRGSQRRAKALRRVARLSARAARIRCDGQHKAALNIASCFGIVILEDLKIRNMTASACGTTEAPRHRVKQKAGLNRSILSQGWGGFATILADKLEERGGTLISVDPAFTSQTCSAFGIVDSQSRENQALFACRHCDFRAHADRNAAINILRQSTASMRMEEGHHLSGEVRTGWEFPLPENPPAAAAGRC